MVEESNQPGWRFAATAAAATFAITMAVLAIDHYLYAQWEDLEAFREDCRAVFYLLFWVFGPPSWFFVEYYVLWRAAGEAKKARIRIARELAQPFWAAVLVTLLVLVP